MKNIGITVVLNDLSAFTALIKKKSETDMKNSSNSLLVFILTLGVFGIINTEMGVVGIIPLIAETFHVSVPEAGKTVSLFALVVAVSGPVMPLLLSGMNRKSAMLLSLGIFIAGNIVSMLTQDFTVILAARVIPAFFHPVYVSMAFTVAAGSADKKDVPKAVAKVFIGVSAGMVLGVPATSFIAGETSFAAAMLFFAAINVVVFVATLIFVPSLPVRERISYGQQLSVLKKPVVWYSVLAVIFINGALFGFFSYLSDYLKNITGVSFKIISLLLFIYGVSNIIGNMFAGKMLALNPGKTIKSIPFALIAVYTALFFAGRFIVPAAALVFILGILGGISGNSGQYMISSAAPEASDFANGLFLTSANLGTAAGTFVCGGIISGIGLSPVVFGAVLFLIFGAFFVFLRQSGPLKNTASVSGAPRWTEQNGPLR